MAGRFIMAAYKVTLKINIAGYEKYIDHEVEADDPKEAAYLALCGETHNEPLTRKEFDNDDDWWDDFMIYTVNGCEKI